MIITNILDRVFRILHNNKTASSYTIEKGDQQYLVTASHVFKDTDNVNELKIYHDKGWKKIPVKVAFNSLGLGDTIVFKLEKDISPRHKIEYGMGNVILYSKAYFLGFPFGMAISDSKVLFNKFPRPFVKSGIISNTDSSKHGLVTIYLDGHNNEGFSGGPVIWVYPNDPNRLKIIGTVSGYLREATTNTDTLDKIENQRANAGIVECFWIQDIFERL
jgi:hypothetical protein